MQKLPLIRLPWILVYALLIISTKSWLKWPISYSFPRYAFCKWKKPKSMKLLTFIDRSQELNVYLGKKPHPLLRMRPCILLITPCPPHGKIRQLNKVLISMNSTVKEMTDSVETRVENFEPREKKSSASSKKKNKERQAKKKRKQDDSNSSVVESRIFP